MTEVRWADFRGCQCVYQIRNMRTSQVYVGSTCNLYGRWREHRSLLRRGKHHAPRLQRAWNRDGETCFAFEILEPVDERRSLFIIEQAWIDFLGAYATRGGYNALPLAGRTFGRKHSPERVEQIRQTMLQRVSTYIITWPDGRDEMVSNLRLFAENHGMGVSGLRAAALNANRLCKGLRVRKASIDPDKQAQIDAEKLAQQTTKQKRYILRHPDGKEDVFTNIAAMARTLGIHDNSLRASIAGRSAHAGGYTARPETMSHEQYLARLDGLRGPPSARWVIGLPDGGSQEVVSLLAFAEAEGLTYSSVHAAARSGREVYRGYRFARA